MALRFGLVSDPVKPDGEKRSLMLANLAIKKAERDLVAEKEIRESTLVPFYYVKRLRRRASNLRSASIRIFATSFSR